MFHTPSSLKLRATRTGWKLLVNTWPSLVAEPNLNLVLCITSISFRGWVASGAILLKIDPILQTAFAYALYLFHVWAFFISLHLSYNLTIWTASLLHMIILLFLHHLSFFWWLFFAGIMQSVPDVAWGKRSRVILDVGCGVASFGGYLFDRDVLAMSLAPKDEHEAQVQFALERGIPAISAVMGTTRLPFPSRVFDIVHCARCRVPWHIEGTLLTW